MKYRVKKSYSACWEDLKLRLDRNVWTASTFQIYRKLSSEVERYNMDLHWIFDEMLDEI